jgi:hypothetical protein
MNTSASAFLAESCPSFSDVIFYASHISREQLGRELTALRLPWVCVRIITTGILTMKFTARNAVTDTHTHTPRLTLHDGKLIAVTSHKLGMSCVQCSRERCLLFTVNPAAPCRSPVGRRNFLNHYQDIV